MALFVDATTAQHARGIRTVILGVLGELENAGIDRLVVAAGPDLPDFAATRVRRVPATNTRAGRLLYQRLLLPFDVALAGRRGVRFDRVLLLDSYLPILRPVPGIRYASLIHDLLPLTHPEYWRPPERAVKRAAFFSLQRARSALFTSTEHNAAEIRRLLGRESRIVCFGCGQLSDDEADAARRHPLPPRDSYFLYVGALEPRKAVTLLVDAFELIATSSDHRLVLVGTGPRSYVDKLRLRISESRYAKRIEIVGGANRDQAIAFLKHAAVLLFPSNAEGFGLPVLEALALGTPVVASDLPAIRSWAGSHAVYAVPGDRADWATKIEFAGNLGDEHRRRGQQLAETYRWRECARALADF